MKAFIKLTTVMTLTIMGTGCVVALGNTYECESECCKRVIEKKYFSDKK